MTLPGFQDIMLPALKFVAVGGQVNSRQIIPEVRKHFKLSDQQAEALLPSGLQRILDNRVTWGLTYLVKAGLVERPSRGHYAITALGKKVLAKPPARIDIAFLRQFESFRDFRALRRTDARVGSGEAGSELPSETASPAEGLDQSVTDLRDAVVDELVKIVRGLDPSDFERLVIDLLRKMGYGSVVHRGGSGDGGIDGEISKDQLGLDMV